MVALTLPVHRSRWDVRAPCSELTDQVVSLSDELTQLRLGEHDGTAAFVHEPALSMAFFSQRRVE